MSILNQVFISYYVISLLLNILVRASINFSIALECYFKLSYDYKLIIKNSSGCILEKLRRVLKC